MVQRNAIYKSIQNTAKNLIVMEEYSRDEAWKYAICKRKYLLDTVLDKFEPPEMDEMAQTEPDDAEPPRKRLSVNRSIPGLYACVLTLHCKVK